MPSVRCWCAVYTGPDTSLGWDPYYVIEADHFGGYYYNDDYIRALSHTHLVGAGVDYVSPWANGRRRRWGRGG